jgi:hypothetical protein
MKKIRIPILLGLLAAAGARADTPLTINSSTPFGCLQNAFILPTPLEVSGTFTLPGVAGSGTIQSSVTADAPSFGYPPEIYFFNYLDEGGVALAAIQGLNQKMESENAFLRTENAELKARLQKIEQAISSSQGQQK